MNERKTKEAWGWGHKSGQVKYCTKKQGKEFTLTYLRTFLLHMCPWFCFCWLKIFILQDSSQILPLPGYLRFSLLRWSLAFLEFSVALILIQLLFWLLLDLFYFLSQADWSITVSFLSPILSSQATTPSPDLHPKYFVFLKHYFASSSFSLKFF